jgi:hypothetical protein
MKFVVLKRVIQKDFGHLIICRELVRYKNGLERWEDSWYTKKSK